VPVSTSVGARLRDQTDVAVEGRQRGVMVTYPSPRAGRLPGHVAPELVADSPGVAHEAQRRVRDRAGVQAADPAATCGRRRLRQPQQRLPAQGGTCGRVVFHCKRMERRDSSVMRRGRPHDGFRSLGSDGHFKAP
jgi:hypothetical protein